MDPPDESSYSQFMFPFFTSNRTPLFIQRTLEYVAGRLPDTIHPTCSRSHFVAVQQRSAHTVVRTMNKVNGKCHFSN